MNSGLQRREQVLLLGAAGAILVVVALLPLVQLFAGLSTAGAGAFSVLGTGRSWTLLSHSIALSAAVTLCALAIGTPLGVLIARMDLLGRRALWLLHAFPMFLPPFVLVLGLATAGAAVTTYTSESAFVAELQPGFNFDVFIVAKPD